MADTTTYAVIRTGGKQYRVAEGQTLLVERLPGDAGATLDLEPLLIAGDGDSAFGADALGGRTVQATIVGHERGPKLRVFKYKPKRGYKRRTGHRQELTRIRIESIGSGGASKSRSRKAAAAKSSEEGTD